ncbi:hypothetical protein LCGC14_2512330, partial [marine sediment metagenome]
MDEVEIMRSFRPVPPPPSNLLPVRILPGTPRMNLWVPRPVVPVEEELVSTVKELTLV